MISCVNALLQTSDLVDILGSNPSQDRSFVCLCEFPLVIKALGKVAHCSLNAEHQFHNVVYCILLLLLHAVTYQTYI